jgi:hypothetical protein
MSEDDIVAMMSKMQVVFHPRIIIDSLVVLEK